MDEGERTRGGQFMHNLRTRFLPPNVHRLSCSPNEFAVPIFGGWKWGMGLLTHRGEKVTTKAPFNSIYL